MNQVVTIKTDPNQHSELIIHPEKAERLGLIHKKFPYLSFGSQKLFVKVRLDRGIPEENIILSRNIIQKLSLPDYPVYEIAVRQNGIVMGPFIGILAHNEDRRLTSSRLNRMSLYVKEYERLHGAIVIFALDKVDQTKRLLEGYCFNPVKKYWQQGVFPYPAAIYRTIGLSAAWKNHFLSVIGDNLFNSRFFNKWEMYQWFSEEPEISPYLPYTILYHSPRDVLAMLEQFPELYIKPVFGLQGRGILRVSTENKSIVFRFREHGKNRIIVCEDSTRAGKYMAERFCHGRYLVQQGIDLLEYKGGIIDFRCILQKNQSNLWVCQKIIGRSGVKGSIVSNISSGGAAFSGERILRKVWTPSEEAITELKQKIVALAIEICSKLTEYGINCASLGLDIGVDARGHLWLIEINNRDPDPSIALDIHDLQLFYTLKTTPLFYGKYLAGFPGNDAGNP